MTIKLDVPVEFDLDKKFELHPDRTLAFLEKMEFQSLVNRFHRLNTNIDQPRKVEQKKKPKKGEDDEQMALF